MHANVKKSHEVSSHTLSLIQHPCMVTRNAENEEKVMKCPPNYGPLGDKRHQSLLIYTPFICDNSQYLALSFFFFRPLLKLLILQVMARNCLMDKALRFLRQAPNQTKAHRVGWGPSKRIFCPYV